MDARDLVTRYVAAWNEPDAARRRARIAQLWAQDGAHYAPNGEARGHEAIAAHMAAAFERYVGPGEFAFRAVDNVDSHHGTVKFNWTMVPKEGGLARAVGFDFFVLDDEGRIRADYQFMEP